MFPWRICFKDNSLTIWVQSPNYKVYYPLYKKKNW